VERIVTMLPLKIPPPDANKSVACDYSQYRDPRRQMLRICRLSYLIILVVGIYFCFSLRVVAQTSDSHPNDPDKSWTATTESQSDNVNPTRTTESHSQRGNRTLDTQSVQRLGTDGHYEPYQDIEKETVKVDSTTVRTITRAFARDSSGGKTLMQVTEEEKHTLPGGDSNLVRSVSNPDTNGNLQLVQRQVAQTKKISKGVEETNTTIMLPSIDGGLAPAMKMQERQTHGANNTVESNKTTLFPDGTGNWQVGETRQSTIRQEGNNLTSEERVSRPDSEGKLGQIARTVSKESETAPGEKSNSVETYSVDVPGSSRDGSLHLVERATITQRTNSTGQQSTEQKVEQPNPGDPSSGLRMTTLTTDRVQPGPSGAKSIRTIQARDANGSLGVVSVDTSKSDNIHAIQIQIGPAQQPK